MTNIFTAGRTGPDVRSDCLVKFEPRTSGGLEITLSSKVAAMFGGAIRTQATQVLADLGITIARLEIDDTGALDWVIAARIETAVLRYLQANNPAIKMTEVRTSLPQFKPYCAYTLPRERYRRSRLYLPGNEPKFFINAGLHKPDGVILDLEDSVAPSEKDAARILVRNALRSVNFYGAERMVRINQGEAGLQDLEWIIPHNVHVVLIPKVEQPEQVIVVEERIKQILNKPLSANDAKVRTPQTEVFLMPIIESALGGINAYPIAISSPKIIGLAIGLEDYTADIGVKKTLEGKESFWLRSQVVNAARAAGVSPIDTVFSDVADMEGLRQSVLEAKALGFDGKGCIHPRQISVVHSAFAPDSLEVEKARRIVAAFEDATAKGLGVVSLGSKMIDPPVVKRALRVVKMAGKTNGE